MDLLIDTNVLLDLVLKREKYQKVFELFLTIKSIGANAYITASAATDLFYVIRKQTHDVEMTYDIMERIFKLVSLLAVTSEDIEDAFYKKWKDFEDCVQYTTALNNHMSYIVSSNIKDFEEHGLQVITVSDFLEEHGL